MDKASIRAQVLAKRDALPALERRALAELIIGRICSLDEFQSASCVMAYSGFDSELDTLPLLQEIRARGKKLVLPRVNRQRGELDLFEVDNLQDDLVAGMWGIREPDPARCKAVDPAVLDLIIMPGAAFDRNGARIGYGKGFYDKLLGGCHTRGHWPVTVAGAFAVQLVEYIATESHDVPVDSLVTEHEVLRFVPVHHVGQVVSRGARKKAATRTDSS